MFSDLESEFQCWQLIGIALNVVITKYAKQAKTKQNMVGFSQYYMGAIFVFFIICFAFGNCACAHIYGEESFCVRIRRAVAITLQAAAMYCCKKQCLCNGRWVKYEREAKCANFLTLQCHFQQSVEEESVIFFWSRLSEQVTRWGLMISRWLGIIWKELRGTGCLNF